VGSGGGNSFMRFNIPVALASAVNPTTVTSNDPADIGFIHGVEYQSVTSDGGRGADGTSGRSNGGSRGAVGDFM